MKKNSTQFVVYGGLIAALYVVQLQKISEAGEQCLDIGRRIYGGEYHEKRNEYE